MATSSPKMLKTIPELPQPAAAVLDLTQSLLLRSSSDAVVGLERSKADLLVFNFPSEP